MKLLTIVRHAKSSWDYAELSDFERPLNERGQRDAPVMAQRVKLLTGKPQRIVSSPALRAITTAQLFAQNLGIDPHDIVVQPKIYEASSDTLLSLIRRFDETDEHVMLFGHNPGLSQLAHLLARCEFEQLPTCGVAHLSLAAKVWLEVTPRCGQLLRWTCPKEKPLD